MRNERFIEAANRRPKYTKYEISKLINEKFNNSNLTKSEFCIKFDIDVRTLNDILEAKRSFNKILLKKSSIILGIDMKELLSDDIDSLPAFRSEEIKDETIETFNIANLLFNEIIMQNKIS